MMKYIFVILLLTIPFTSIAESMWYEEYEGEWWTVKYPELSCEKANKFGTHFKPDYLIENAECIFEQENSIKGKLVSLNCEKKFNGGFLLAVSQAACEEAIEAIKETLAQEK